MGQHAVLMAADGQGHAGDAELSSGQETAAVGTYLYLRCTGAIKAPNVCISPKHAHQSVWRLLPKHTKQGSQFAAAHSGCSSLVEVYRLMTMPLPSVLRSEP